MTRDSAAKRQDEWAEEDHLRFDVALAIWKQPVRKVSKRKVGMETCGRVAERVIADLRLSGWVMTKPVRPEE